ncbi:hypothetical protein SS50377_22506 [Spironucleus salmonicida]|uniref:Uncharacterized protein n=1 Tax=Spironucleus salmonicida TaxID=348837 RepID=V6LCM1_9EUKA|nr:hypothetical protein SS50377_22506 [Spironucleus salmonicida]|eukprot:EST42003.1 Hypothetical protein SS50377_18309 [Spironucleus salmonicida]
MYKTTQQRHQIQQKTRKTKALKREKQISLWEQPISYPPSQVYFKKVETLQLDKIPGATFKQSTFKEDIIRKITQNTDLIQQCLEFIESSTYYVVQIDDFTDFLVLLKAVTLFKGGKIAYVGDLQKSIFRQEIDCFTELEYNTFGVNSQYSASFAINLFVKPKSKYFYNSISTFSTTEKFKQIFNYVLSYHSKILFIHTNDQDTLMNRLLSYGTTSRQISNIEFFDRPYNNKFDQVLIISDFFFQHILQRPYLTKVHFCLQPQDFLNAVNLIYSMIINVDNIQKSFNHQLQNYPKTRIQMLQFIADFNNQNSKLIFSTFKAFPTNDQINQNKDLLQLRGTNFSYEDFNVMDLIKQGVILNSDGKKFQDNIKMSKEKLKDGQKAFLLQQINALKQEFYYVFGDQRYPKFPSQISEQFKQDLIETLSNSNIQGEFMSQLVLLNKTIMDDLGFMIQTVCDDQDIIQLVDFIRENIYLQ